MKSVVLFSFLAILLSASNVSCEKKEHTDLFEYKDPVDLSFILQAYEWQQNYEGDDEYTILWSKITPGIPEDEFYLFEDTSFVLRVPEYVHSKQPFLANAEDFYNSCSFAWNIYSNFEVWYRGHTADLLRDDADVRKSIQGVSVNFIHDKDVRKAAQNLKDSVLLLIATSPEQWEEDVDVMDRVISYGDVIESKAYKFYEDEEAFVQSLDSIHEIAEGMAMDKFQRYLNASEDDQLKVILGELAACQSFDEQCSLWRNWANCDKSVIENEWLVGVGMALMKSGNYSPILNRIWVTWRALCQTMFFGMSRDSAIPNHFYNEFRKMCYVSCLKRIADHPDDVFAMNCAAAIGGRTNLNRFGQNYFGNETMIEEALMMPKRYHSEDSSDSDEEEE